MKEKLKLMTEWTEAAVVYTLIYYTVVFAVLGVWYMFTNESFRKHPVDTIKEIRKRVSDKTKNMFHKVNRKLEYIAE